MIINVQAHDVSVKRSLTLSCVFCFQTAVTKMFVSFMDTEISLRRDVASESNFLCNSCCIKVHKIIKELDVSDRTFFYLVLYSLFSYNGRKFRRSLNLIPEKYRASGLRVFETQDGLKSYIDFTLYYPSTWDKFRKTLLVHDVDWEQYANFLLEHFSTPFDDPQLEIFLSGSVSFRSTTEKVLVITARTGVRAGNSPPYFKKVVGASMYDFGYRLTTVEDANVLWSSLKYFHEQVVNYTDVDAILLSIYTGCWTIDMTLRGDSLQGHPKFRRERSE